MCEVIVQQGEYKYVDYGSSDVVIFPGYMCSCVLAIAFFKDEFKAVAYHWAGFNMSSDGREAREFLAMCERHTVSKILVLGNYIYDKKQENKRKENMQIIQRVFDGVETHYYVNLEGKEAIIFQICRDGQHQDLSLTMTEIFFDS